MHLLLYTVDRGDLMRRYYEYKDYSVIIGDIIDSKKITDRQKVQTKFKDVLHEINKKYTDDIASQFAITLGDEFQGLLKNRENIINIIFEIEMAMFPIEMRFGVGIGEVTTAINFESSSEIDGPAYHRARAMVKELESSEGQHLRRAGNILIASQEKNARIDQLLNSILSVCTALKSKWTVKQREIIQSYLLNDENQSKTAVKLGIAQSSVSRALNSAEFATYQAAMETVNAFLTEEGDD